MKSLVIYDSGFGNTKIVADTIAQELRTKAVSVKDANNLDLITYDLVVVGSPINGWRPTERMNVFLDDLGKDLKGVKVAAFDTRVKLFIHGDAMRKIERALQRAGGKPVVNPMPFYVKDTEGPLFDGETEKAKDWAKEIIKLV